MPFSPVDTTLAQIDQGINSAASVAATIPGIGQIIAGVLKIGEMFVNAIGIRSGADEADVITKVQTPLGNQLIAINAAIPYANVTQLTTMYQAVGQLGAEFQSFVGQGIFTDGRASTQALNTIMPLINGTGGYTSKNSGPTCEHCGPAGGGEDGIQGSILRQIQQLNGGQPMIMAPSQPTQGVLSSYYMTLESPSTTYGDAIPQAGTLPLYPPNTGSPGAPQVVSVGLSADAKTLAIGAFLLFLAFRKRG